MIIYITKLPIFPVEVQAEKCAGIGKIVNNGVDKNKIKVIVHKSLLQDNFLSINFVRTRIDQ